MQSFYYKSGENAMSNSSNSVGNFVMIENYLMNTLFIGL